MATESPVLQPNSPAGWVLAIINPILRGLLESFLHGLVSKGLAVLRVHGHNSGKEYRIPVAWHELNEAVYVLTSAVWQHNIGEDTEVEITHAGRRLSKIAQRVTNPEAVARTYLHAVEEYGLKKAQKRTGLKIDGENLGFEEVAAACADQHLTAIRLTSPE